MNSLPKKVNLILAHPNLKQSRVNRALFSAVQNLESVKVTNLYDEYPSFFIDVEKEKQKLEQSDILILQHPFYWYHMPALLKHWIDEVFEYGWAYGPSGNALRNKYWAQAISTGGAKEVYQATGYNNFTIEELLRPHEQTALLCGMKTICPFLTQGTGSLSDEEIKIQAQNYRNWVLSLQNENFIKTYSTCLGK
jgi:glutathione-regulated potassium-efflux system ancillary protein KefG